METAADADYEMDASDWINHEPMDDARSDAMAISEADVSFPAADATYVDIDFRDESDDAGPGVISDPSVYPPSSLAGSHTTSSVQIAEPARVSPEIHTPSLRDGLADIQTSLQQRENDDSTTTSAPDVNNVDQLAEDGEDASEEHDDPTLCAVAKAPITLEASLEAAVVHAQDCSESVINEDDGTAVPVGGNEYEPEAVRITFNGQDFVLWSSSETPSYLGTTTSDAGETDIMEVEAPALHISEDVVWQPLDSFFVNLREKAVLGDFLDEFAEVILTFADLDLEVQEDNVYCRDITLDDVMQLYRSLGHVDSLHISVSERPRFITKYNELAQHVAGLLERQLDNSEDELEEREDVLDQLEASSLQNGNESLNLQDFGVHPTRASEPTMTPQDVGTASSDQLHRDEGATTITKTGNDAVEINQPHAIENATCTTGENGTGLDSNAELMGTSSDATKDAVTRSSYAAMPDNSTGDLTQAPANLSNLNVSGVFAEVAPAAASNAVDLSGSEGDKSDLPDAQSPKQSGDDGHTTPEDSTSDENPDLAAAEDGAGTGEALASAADADKTLFAADLRSSEDMDAVLTDDESERQDLPVEAAGISVEDGFTEETQLGETLMQTGDSAQDQVTYDEAELEYGHLHKDEAADEDELQEESALGGDLNANTTPVEDVVPEVYEERSTAEARHHAEVEYQGHGQEALELTASASNENNRFVDETAMQASHANGASDTEEEQIIEYIDESVDVYGTDPANGQDPVLSAALRKRGLSADLEDSIYDAPAEGETKRAKIDPANEEA